jgi:hypothetical protein
VLKRMTTTVLLSTALLALAPNADAQTALSPEGCTPGETPALHHGFRDFGEVLGPKTVGTPLDCEHADRYGVLGDTTQTTSSGTFAYHKATNEVVFTDSGMHHWATSPTGVLTWSGIQPYPPDGRTSLYTWDTITLGQAP